MVICIVTPRAATQAVCDGHKHVVMIGSRGLVQDNYYLMDGEGEGEGQPHNRSLSSLSPVRQCTIVTAVATTPHHLSKLES